MHCSAVMLVRVKDVPPNGYTMDRATVRQKNTGRPAKFELTDQTRQRLSTELRHSAAKARTCRAIPLSSRPQVFQLEQFADKLARDFGDDRCVRLGDTL